MRDEGGGASRSTEPAGGTSAPTDVSLREYVGDKIQALDRHLTHEIESLRRETVAANRNSERAIEVAAHEAAERLAAHNGLIEQMRQQAQTFSTREAVEAYEDASDKRFSRLERFQAMLTGGMIFVSVIGVANIVKVWTA